MYINGISHVVRYSNVEQYADDTLLYFASDNVNIIKSNLSSDLESVPQWLSANYLILNSTKSKIMLVGTHQRLASKSFSISSNGRDLERLEKFKYLGVFMDPTLSLKSHINYLGKKISSRLGMLRRARKILPQSSCIILYNTMILPLFDYCSVVWDSCGAISKGYLDKLNGRAASIILNRAVSETDIIRILGWPSLQSRRDYLKCMLVFKSMNGLAPSYLLSDFTQAKKYHTYNTRHRDLIRLPLAKSTKYQGSFRYNGGCTFNNLPKAKRSLDSLKTFKTECMRFFRQIELVI